MAYRQPNVDRYALNGYSFFRMKQELASPGDIFESPQSSHGFALGPDSDISEVNVAYLDEQVPDTFFNQLTITPQRSFASPITAFNKTKFYAPSKRPDRILIWPSEIYDSTYTPAAYNAETDGLVREPPVIDILQFFSPQPTTTPQRADKTYYYESLPFGSSGRAFILVPYYGRRYASITLLVKEEEVPMDLTVTGVSFRIAEAEKPAIETPLLVCNSGLNGQIGSQRSVVIGTGYNVQTYNVYETQNTDPPIAPADLVNGPYNAGLFDYLQISLDPGVVAEESPDVAIKIVVSDIVGRASA